MPSVKQPGYSTRVEPTRWHALNRNKLQEWVHSTFKDVPDADELHLPDTCSLFTHQHIIKDLIQPDSPYRGLLLFHGLGTGKSRSSIAIAEVLSSSYKINVLLPASLRSNYIEEIKKCGNSLYSVTGTWKFTPKDKSDEYQQLYDDAISEGVSDVTLSKNKGIWIRSPSKASNYDTLNDEQQKQISKQIDDQIASRYNFIHYNGLNRSRIQEIRNSVPKGHSPFDDSVVIIDEVHNLVSRIVNNSYIARSLYKMIMSAKNAKVIILSGTPVINKPVEVGVLANLVRGYMRQIVVKFKKGMTPDQWKSLEKALDDHTRIDYYQANYVQNTLHIYPLTEGFEWTDKSKFLMTKSSVDDSIKKELDELFKTSKLHVAGIEDMPTTLFPIDDEDEFDKMFIDYKVLFKGKGVKGAVSNVNKNESPIINQNVMSRRLQGIVSYYEAYDPALYPKVSAKPELVKVHMSDNMFTKYMDARQEEIAREARSRERNSKNRGNELKSDSVYRAFSRALCNYTFPETIKRPFPSTMKQMKDEMDDLDGKKKQSKEDDNEDDNVGSISKLKIGTNKDAAYAQQLGKALSELRRQASDYLTGEGLEKHGPKYAALMDNIDKLKRPALIYSQFRNVEGLGIMKYVLDAAGYTEFRIGKNKNGEWVTDMTKEDWAKPKYTEFTGDKERNQVILSMFNNNISSLPPNLHKAFVELNGKKPLSNLRGEHLRILMITQSGAEGISLKNVRQVHILEPYWNEIRIKQVVGRAVRAGSHLDLPIEERNVDVYMYLTEFSESQKRHAKVMATEFGITSDEYIYGIAQKKSRITDELLSIIKSSAVDCMIHRKVHNNQVKCAKVPDNFGVPIKGVLYSYKGVYEDTTDETLAKQTRTHSRLIGFIKCIRSNSTTPPIRVPYYKDTMEALNPFKYMESQEKEVIGRIVIMEDGSPHVVKFES